MAVYVTDLRAVQLLVDLGAGNTDGPEAGFRMQRHRHGSDRVEYRNGNEKETASQNHGAEQVTDVTLKRGVMDR